MANKFIQFLKDNSTGGMFGAAVGLFLSLSDVSGMAFALQRLLPNISPEKVAVGEHMIYNVLVGAIIGVILSAVLKDKIMRILKK